MVYRVERIHRKVGKGPRALKRSERVRQERQWRQAREAKRFRFEQQEGRR